MPTHLFVYGTLRETFTNPPATRLRHCSRYIGEGVITGQLYDVGSYPGALYLPDGPNPVHGSVYELFQANMAELLAILDEYEGVQPVPLANESDEYIRCIVPVVCGDNQIDCWAYLYNWPVDKLNRIESGDYVQYLSKQAGI